MLGGPQAGLVVGRADLVAKLAKNPLKRALRLDKIRLAALEAVLRLYADPDRLAERLPTLRSALSAAKPRSTRSAQRLLPAVARGIRRASPRSSMVETRSQIGSGALPVSLLPSAALALRPAGKIKSGAVVEGLARALRALPIPVIGHIEAGKVVLDLRCLEDEAEFLAQLGKLRRDATMILATAGHIDHGKTALVQALTGVDADRLPEEKRRGLTIDLGFAYATLPNGGEIGFVDVPGHERFLPNMLAGVLSIDRVLLVVAADDGPRPQTIEHLDILELIGVAEVTGVVTKIDRVAPDRVEQVVGGVKELLAAAGYADSLIFPVSSRTGDGIAALTRHLEKTAAIAAVERAEAIASGLFRMPIDRAFTLPGIGLVVTGTVAARRCRHRRPALGQPRRRHRAGARAACAEPADRGRLCRRALRRQHCWVFPRRRRAPPRRLAGGAGAASAGATARSLPARLALCRRRHCAMGCRSICISAPRISSAAPRYSAAERSPPAKPALCRSIWSGRRVRSMATALFCATMPRATPWAGAGSSTRWRRGAGGACLPGSKCSKPWLPADPAKAFAAIARRRRGRRFGAFRVGAQSGAGRVGRPHRNRKRAILSGQGPSVRESRSHRLA